MTALRVVQARLLVRPLWRSGAWWLVPMAAGVVVALASALRVAGAEVNPAAPTALGAFLMAAVAGFALDDDSAATVAPLPTPPAYRSGLRVLGACVAVGGGWLVVLAYATTFDPPVPVAWPTLLLAVVVAVALLAASFWGGASSAPAVVAFLAGAAKLPEGWTVLDRAPGAGGRLAAVLVVTAGALALRCARDRTGY